MMMMADDDDEARTRSMMMMMADDDDEARTQLMMTVLSVPVSCGLTDIPSSLKAHGSSFTAHTLCE